MGIGLRRRRGGVVCMGGRRRCRAARRYRRLRGFSLCWSQVCHVGRQGHRVVGRHRPVDRLPVLGGRRGARQGRRRRKQRCVARWRNGCARVRGMGKGRRWPGGAHCRGECAQNECGKPMGMRKWVYHEFLAGKRSNARNRQGDPRLPMIRAHPVQKRTNRTNAHGPVSGQRGLGRAFWKSEVDRPHDARVEGNDGKLLRFHRHAGRVRRGHRGAKAAGGTRVALATGIVPGGSIIVRIGMTCACAGM
jgi:hypothetical protein